MLGEDGRLTDSACGSTTVWDANLAALRPAGIIRPASDDGAQPAAAAPARFDPWSVIGPAGVALVVAAALLGAGLLARGKQGKG